jgi:hypothetical protein
LVSTGARFIRTVVSAASTTTKRYDGIVCGTNFELAFWSTRFGVVLSVVDAFAGVDSAGAVIFSVEPSAAALALRSVVALGETGVFVSPPHATATAMTAARL